MARSKRHYGMLPFGMVRLIYPAGPALDANLAQSSANCE
jgi:hypothetical protein